MDERKRDSMIAYLRHRMEEFGIKPEDLAAVLAAEPKGQKAERYRSATGDSWDGQGEMPQWLKESAERRVQRPRHDRESARFRPY